MNTTVSINQRKSLGGNTKVVPNTLFRLCHVECLVAVNFIDIQHFTYWKYKAHEMLVLHTLKHRHVWGKPDGCLKQYRILNEKKKKIMSSP